MPSNNPLQQYFRQPAIYIKLPSNGQYYPQGALDMPPNNELPVYPMTAVDEITYRTPDALFNGTAVVNVIQSCVPNIKDAWAVPSTDVDTILTAIRIASFGHNMPVDCFCPKCDNEDNFEIDLRTVLETLHAPNYNEPIQHRDLEIFFKPMNYQTLNSNNQLQFEEQKILQMLPDAEIPDQQKITALSESMKKLTDVTVNALVQSIAAVKTPDSMVTESAYIITLLSEFLAA